MKLDDLEDFAIRLAMDHLLKNAGAVGVDFSGVPGEWRAWMFVAKHLEGSKRKAFVVYGRSQDSEPVRKAVVARVLAKFILKHCGAECVTVNFDNHVDIFCVERGDGTK